MKGKAVDMTSTVRVCIQGRGHHVKAYVLGQKDLKRLLSATDADAIYEDNPYSVVGMLSPYAHAVTLGFDPSRSGLFNCWVEIGSDKRVIEDIVFDSGDADGLESFDEGSQLIVREDVRLELGRDVKLKKSQVLVFETISLRNAILSVEFEAVGDFELKEIQLKAANLDVPFDLARASYDLGLLDGMDQDIRSVSYKDKDYSFDLEIINSTQSSFHLCRRSDDGDWVAEFLG